MRKEFRKILVQSFSDKIHESGIGFSTEKVGPPHAFPSEVMYTKRTLTGRIRLFVILVPDAKREAFTVEIGWSTLDRFPELTMRPSGDPQLDRKEFGCPEFICRLGDQRRFLIAHAPGSGLQYPHLVADQNNNLLTGFVYSYTRVALFITLYGSKKHSFTQLSTGPVFRAAIGRGVVPLIITVK